MRKGLGGVFLVLAASLECQRGALQPGEVGGPGGTGSGGATAAAGAGGHQGGTGGGPGGSGAAAGGTGGAIIPPSCATISTENRRFNPCGRTFSLAYSSDGQFLAGGMDTPRPNVHLWRLSDGMLVRDFAGLGGATYHVSFSPDGRLLATAGGYPDSGAGFFDRPDIVGLWDVSDGSLLRILPVRCGSYASTAAFSHDGSLLVTAGHLGAVEVWRVADGSLLASVSIPTTVHNAHFSPDDTKLIVASVDRRATVWSLPAAGLMLTLDGIADEMADAAFPTDGGEIASTGLNHGVVLWSAKTGAVLQTLPGHDIFVSHVVWLGSERLISNDWGGTIKTWTRDGGSFRQSGKLTLNGQSLGIAIAPDGRTVAAGGADPTGTEGFVFFAP